MSKKLTIDDLNELTEDYHDELCKRVDALGFASLTEEEQFIVLFWQERSK